MRGFDSSLDDIRFAVKATCIVSEISIYNFAKSKRVEAGERERGQHSCLMASARGERMRRKRMVRQIWNLEEAVGKRYWYEA